MNTQAIVEPIIESILESISERFVDIKPRLSQDVSSLKCSALMAAISLTLPLLLEAERRRTLEAVRKLGEQDIKEEYIEHEHPDIKPLNTKKVKEEVKIEKFNDKVKIEIEMSAVSTPVKQKNTHVFVEKNLSPINKRPITSKTVEDGAETDNDCGKTESTATSTLDTRVARG